MSDFLCLYFFFFCAIHLSPATCLSTSTRSCHVRHVNQTPGPRATAADTSAENTQEPQVYTQHLFICLGVGAQPSVRPVRNY